MAPQMSGALLFFWRFVRAGDLEISRSAVSMISISEPPETHILAVPGPVSLYTNVLPVRQSGSWLVLDVKSSFHQLSDRFGLNQGRSEDLQQSSARVHAYQFRPRRRGL